MYDEKLYEELTKFNKEILAEKLNGLEILALVAKIKEIERNQK